MSTKWADGFLDELIEAKGEKKGLALYRLYDRAFPSNYAERYSPQDATEDVALVEEMLGKNETLAVSLAPGQTSDLSEIHFKLFHVGTSISLSEIMPMLEHMGFHVLVEIPYHIDFSKSGNAKQDKSVWIHDFKLRPFSGEPVNLAHAKDVVEEAFLKVWNREMEDDGFNCLVMVAGLNWRDIVVLRAYARYLRQMGFTLSQDYINAALAANPTITNMLTTLFHARFDPKAEKKRKNNCAALESDIRIALDFVSNADEDRILRHFLNLIKSTLRTNFFQMDEAGQEKSYLSLKIDSLAVDGLPLPRPMVEIFVYSPHFEAVHLRGGKVARGGIRWSDRPEDFRTEILGLMKAQQVKNAVIVPVGSKGGFVVKQAFKDTPRDKILENGITCYRSFIAGLLDITDNMVGGKIVPPKNVVRHDQDDPYLVVAADKGTATFSDIANEISESYNFWLGDAFASGGSNGYDHKLMGITARGAWESVKRHFREMGHDIQSKPFTAVGVGDMSGDVFGNGMLLSEQTKLVAAFNHLHIFIDPNPDPAPSYAERQRLFDMPRSTWADYNSKLLSKGGGVFSRKLKTIKISKEIQKLLQINTEEIAPNDLIQHILKAEVDLLWFGGIGTYVKAAHERHADAGDRANDALRVDAKTLRTKVVGEGANLGLTQWARIDYALQGGRINTDALDNSGGVDCSDHEVNIKILLNAEIRDGKYSLEERNDLLLNMTDKVASLVLEDNYLQSQAVTLQETQGHHIIEDQKRLIRLLEQAGRLDREIEFLPSPEEMDARFADKKGLTRPEIAVLMGYSKLWLFDEILDSDLPDDPYLTQDVLEPYFPDQMQKSFKKAMKDHPLKREIIATHITNSLINRVGGTFVTALKEKTGMPTSVIARAYLIGRIAFSACDIWDEIEALDNKVSASVQTDMFMEVSRILERLTIWILRNGTQPLKRPLSVTIKEMTENVSALSACIDESLKKAGDSYIDEQAALYVERGVPQKTAHRVAGLALLSAANGIGYLAKKNDVPVSDVAALYYKIGVRMNLRFLRDAGQNVPINNHWKHLALAALEEEFFDHQFHLTRCVLESLTDEEKKSPLSTDIVERWIAENSLTTDRADQLIYEVNGASNIDLAMLSVVSRHFRAMSRAPSV